MTKQKKTMKTNVSAEDMQVWLEAITYGTREGKELTKEDEQYLRRIGSKEVTLAEASNVAKVVTSEEVQQAGNMIQQLLHINDVIMLILKDELGVTEEQFNSAVEKREEKMREYMQAKQDELKERMHKEAEEDAPVEEQEQADKPSLDEFVIEPAEEPSNEKVVQFKPKNDEQ